MFIKSDMKKYPDLQSSISHHSLPHKNHDTAQTLETLEDLDPPKEDDDEKEKKVSRFQWLKDLYAYSDEDILKRFGEESLYYLLYEKAVARSFLFISIVNIPIIYLYISASIDK